MNKFINAVSTSVGSFVREEEGAQVIEYALIIAVVSIALVIALQGLTEGDYFQDFIDRVGLCLQGDGDCAVTAPTP